MAPEPNCDCWACWKARGAVPTHFVVCQECGNKRCPHCSDHRFKCTGSNEPGQVGVFDQATYSIFERSDTE